MQTTPDLEDLTQTLIATINVLISNYAAAADHSLRLSLNASAEIVRVKRLPPCGQSYTNAQNWRTHIRALHRELLERFGAKEFRISDLRFFLENHVELLPGDLEKYNDKIRPTFRWHQTVHDCISCRAQTWGNGGPVIVYVSRNCWKLEPLP
jgi:hypothetical protein